MQVVSITIEGRVCRDMYDEHPGFAFFYTNGQETVPVPRPLSLHAGRILAEVWWHKLRAQTAADDDQEERDGQFSPTRMVLYARGGAVVQVFERGEWVREFDAPDTWPALLARADADSSEAAVEAGWDNFSTAEGLRASATRLRRRVTISQAHYGVLPIPPEPPKATPPVKRMRGLDVRVAFALAMIKRISDPENGLEDLQAVERDAEELGLSEHHQGLFEPPIMFADEPYLLKAWEAGQRWGFETSDFDD